MAYNILIPHKDGLNSYLRLLSQAVRDKGWNIRCEFDPNTFITDDVVWIHWPEQLTDYASPKESDIVRFANLFKSLPPTKPIIWTVHNLYRHGNEEHAGFNALYDLTARYADIHLHHGLYSVRASQSRFGLNDTKVIRTITHGGYWNLIGSHTQESARKELGMDDTNPILLVFGQIREYRELELIFKMAEHSGWHILVVGRLPAVSRAKQWSRQIRIRRLRKNLTVVQSHIHDSFVDCFLKASDAVFIPRVGGLNSGNIFLGFTFGLPVLGPDIANMGETLRKTSNFFFNPSDPRSALSMSKKMLSHDLRLVGEANRQWLSANGQWSGMAETAISAINEYLADKCTSRQPRT